MDLSWIRLQLTINLLFLCCLGLKPVTCDLFSALVDLEYTVETERKIVEELQSYINSEEDRLTALKSLLTEIDAGIPQIESGVKQDENYFANPINAYRKISSLVLELRPLLEKAVLGKDEENPAIGENSDLAEILAYDSSTLVKSKKSVILLDKLIKDLPDINDLKGSIDALFRLQDIYNLDTHRLASGIYSGLNTSTPMTAFECFGIGYYAHHYDDFYHATMWLTEALHILENKDLQSPHYRHYSLRTHSRKVKRITVLDYLTYSVFKQGKLRLAQAYNEEMLVLNPEFDRAKKNKLLYEMLLKEKESETKGKKGDYEDLNSDEVIFSKPPVLEEYMRHYQALCRGENLKANTATQSCSYIRPHPMFIYAPVKEMVLSNKPKIVFWYDVISEAEMDHIKKVSTPRLKRATVQDPETGDMIMASYRVSKSCWLDDNFSKITKRINKRIEALTGLSLESAEQLQIVNYGIGGQYEPHYDHAMDDEKASFSADIGNRIATMIFYMSDVHLGGSTVFTEIGARVMPKKGGAAFWWNLLPNGRSDMLTRHAGCPVLSGSKWVMNKWFHERDQEFRRPCPKDYCQG